MVRLSKTAFGLKYVRPVTEVRNMSTLTFGYTQESNFALLGECKWLPLCALFQAVKSFLIII